MDFSKETAKVYFTDAERELAVRALSMHALLACEALPERTAEELSTMPVEQLAHRPGIKEASIAADRQATFAIENLAGTLREDDLCRLGFALVYAAGLPDGSDGLRQLAAAARSLHKDLGPVVATFPDLERYWPQLPDAE